MLMPSICGGGKSQSSLQYGEDDGEARLQKHMEGFDLQTPLKQMEGFDGEAFTPNFAFNSIIDVLVDYHFGTNQKGKMDYHFGTEGSISYFRKVISHNLILPPSQYNCPQTKNTQIKKTLITDNFIQQNDSFTLTLHLISLNVLVDSNSSRMRWVGGCSAVLVRFSAEASMSNTADASLLSTRQSLIGLSI
ncbi:hypothetical protein LXL04_035977 [Taraxacum kok-saghyz]